MLQVNISSLVGGKVREIKFPGYTNTFLIAKIGSYDIYHNRFLVVDKESMTILLDANRLVDLINKLAEFLADRDQAQLNEYIRLVQEL